MGDSIPALDDIDMSLLATGSAVGDPIGDIAPNIGGFLVMHEMAMDLLPELDADTLDTVIHAVELSVRINALMIKVVGRSSDAAADIRILLCDGNTVLSDTSGVAAGREKRGDIDQAESIVRLSIRK